MPVAGGRADEICAASNFRGGAWSAGGVIVFAPEASGPLYRVPARGGEPTPVTSLDAARKQSGHRFPIFLPDGQHFLFAALPGGRDGAFDIFAGSLDGDAATLVASMDSAPVYAEPGWLLFSRRGALAAQAFDASTLKLTGKSCRSQMSPPSRLIPRRRGLAGAERPCRQRAHLRISPRRLTRPGPYGSTRPGNLPASWNSLPDVMRMYACRQTGRVPYSFETVHARNQDSGWWTSNEVRPRRFRQGAVSTRRRPGHQTARASSLPAIETAPWICSRRMSAM